MHFVKTFKLLTSFSTAVCLAACSLVENKQLEQEKRNAEADKRHAEAKLAMLLATRKPPATGETEEEASLSEASQPEAFQYDPIRVKKAGTLKRWAGVHVPEINLDAYLKTAWKDGRINIRLALLGQKSALELFNSSWPKYKLSFAAQDGTNLYQVIIPSSEMRFAANQINNNIPTLEFEGSQECPLDIYEQSVQWNFEWEQ